MLPGGAAVAVAPPPLPPAALPPEPSGTVVIGGAARPVEELKTAMLRVRPRGVVGRNKRHAMLQTIPKTLRAVGARACAAAAPHTKHTNTMTTTSPSTPPPSIITSHQQGGKLRKYGRRGRPKDHHFRLSADLTALMWTSANVSVCAPKGGRAANGRGGLSRALRRDTAQRSPLLCGPNQPLKNTPTRATHTHTHQNNTAVPNNRASRAPCRWPTWRACSTAARRRSSGASRRRSSRASR